MPTFATWNVNSIRSRLSHLLDWLREEQPDVALLQETKVIDEAFPYEQIEELGYNIAIHGQKTYNGVAILSKGPLEEVEKALPGEEEDVQARFIEALTTLDGEVYRIASVYVPNGSEVGSEKFAYKLRFLERLHHWAEEKLGWEEKLVVGGDYNVAPERDDIYAPDKLDGTVCFHMEERRRLRGLLHSGLADAYRLQHPETTTYSWWDYRGGSWPQNKGYRIDHILLSPEATDCMVDAGVHMDMRGREKASDHAPVWVCLTPNAKESPWQDDSEPDEKAA